LKYKRLGNSDLKVSIIGLGTGQFGSIHWGYGSKYKENDFLKIVHSAIENNINLFDTSETYSDGLSEIILGKALKEYNREDFIIISKVAPWNLKYEKVIKAADRSLKRLNTDFIDIYMVHYPNPLVPLKETCKALEDLVKKGKIKNIGVSNFPSFLLKNVQKELSYDIIANEIEYNLVSRRAKQNTIPFCRSENISLIAYSPLARGVLTGKYSKGNPPDDRARAFYIFSCKKFLKKIQPLLRRLQEIAEEKEASVAQIALSYIINEEPFITIPACLSEDEIRINAKAPDINLNSKDINSINSVSVQPALLSYLFDNLLMRPISWIKEAIRHSFIDE